MPDLRPSPNPQTLRHHPRVFNSLASTNQGRTANEIICPHSGHTVPCSHGHAASCPCGLRLATWGNTLYTWPQDLCLHAPEKTPFPLGPPENRAADHADATYRNTGGSTITITPQTTEGYLALLDADTGIAPGGTDWAGIFPALRLHAPTSTNVRYDPRLRDLYRRAMTALAGLRLAHDGSPGPNPYPIGDPEALWP